ncbi:MAG: mechanosensitive ion channel [Saprospiraceae bacterium]|jgi:small-conductance mechanosensitive channel|nr:mechanosensitive ion channel [Saprospiraceae bacterium]
MNLQELLDFSLFDFGKSGTLTIRNILIAITILIIGWLLAWFINKVLLARFFQRKKIDIGRQFTLKRLVLYLVYTGAILTALQSLGISLSVLWAGSAAFLVGIGLGLQDTFKDFVSGLILLFEGTVEVGDIIQTEGLVAVVKSIGIRTSLVETRDEISIIIPNSQLVAEKVTNWSHLRTPSRFQVNVGVAYSSDVQLVEKLLLEAANKHPSILKKPIPFIEFKDFGNSSLDFTVHYFSNAFLQSEIIKSDLRFHINKVFREHEIEIPFPQRDLWVRNPKDLKS